MNREFILADKFTFYLVNKEPRTFKSRIKDLQIR